MKTRDQLETIFNPSELDIICDALNHYADSLQKMVYDARDRSISSDYPNGLFEKANVCYELAEIFND